MLVLGPEPSVLRTLSDRERRRVVRPPALHRFCLALPATLPIQAGPSLNQDCSLITPGIPTSPHSSHPRVPTLCPGKILLRQIGRAASLRPENFSHRPRSPSKHTERGPNRIGHQSCWDSRQSPAKERLQLRCWHCPGTLK